jgi:hypothetical protein
MRATIAIGVAALLSTASALAAGVVTSVKGEGRAILGAGHGPLFQNQRLESGTTVTTGPNALAVIRFDDGQDVVLNQNSELRIREFHYREANPAADRSVLNLVKGAMRVVTGAIAARSPGAFTLILPQGTVAVPGSADFTVALVNPAYISVSQGLVTATNGAGTASFKAGETGIVANSATLAAVIPASSLPVAASEPVATLIAVTPGAAGGAASGAAAQTGAVVGGVAASTGTVVVLGVAAAVIGVAASRSSTHH